MLVTVFAQGRSNIIYLGIPMYMQEFTSDYIERHTAWDWMKYCQSLSQSCLWLVNLSRPHESYIEMSWL